MDLIDRQAAIRAVNTALFPKINTAKDAEKALRDLPSAQPDFDITVKIDKAYDDGYKTGYLQVRHDWGDWMSDLISRQAAIDALEQIFDRCEEIEAHLPEGDPDRTGYKMYPDYMTVWKYLHQLPSAQPDLDEWCTDCKEYDAERHCCPRWNRVIRQTLSEQTEWNNHTVACLLAELFGDACACNFNGIDEWLPEKCEVIDACPNPVGVACWEQFLKHRAERRTDE